MSLAKLQISPRRFRNGKRDKKATEAARRQETDKREQEIEKLSSTQKLEFDEFVARLRAHEGKLRAEQRVAMQQKIEEAVVLGLLDLGGGGFESLGS